MQGPAIFIFIFSILYLVGIYTGYRDRNKGGLQMFFWCLISLIIYIIGVNYFYDEVRTASTHGNTVHGWYSKSNGGEKAIALLWAVFFPIVTNGLIFLFVYKRLEKEEKRNKQSSSSFIKPKSNINQVKTNTSEKEEVKPNVIDLEWWNDLDIKWKKILNFNISKPNIIFTDKSKSLKDIKPSEINNLIEFQGIIDKPNYAEAEQILNLKELNLYLKKITDLTPLNYLLKLENLNVGFNENITSFNPISNLINLKELHLNYAFKNIRELSILRNLKGLNELYINNNSLTNVEELSNFHRLKILDISNNQINDIYPIKKLKELNTLYADRNLIVDLGAIIDLENLEKLHLSKNNIKDIKPLVNLKKLKILYLGGNNIISLSEISKLQNLEYLDLYDNKLTDLKFLYDLTNLKGLNISYNPLDKDSVSRLRQTLPNCEITFK